MEKMHDDAGLGGEYNDDMVDEEDEETFGFERRQTTRNSLEQSVTGSTIQNIILSLRPSQSGDSAPVWSSLGNSSRDSEALSAGRLDGARFYTFDSPVLPFDSAPSSLFRDRLSGAVPPPYIDFFCWFGVSTCSRIAPATNPPAGLLGRESRTYLEVGENNSRWRADSTAGQQNDDRHNNSGQESNQPVEVQSCEREHNPGFVTDQVGEFPEAIDPMENVPLDRSNNGHGSMVIGEGNANPSDNIEGTAVASWWSSETRADSSAHHVSVVQEDTDIHMDGAETERESDQPLPILPEDAPVTQNLQEVQDASQTDETSLNNEAQAQPPTYTAPTAEDIDPEFLAALPPDIQAEVLVNNVLKELYSRLNTSSEAVLSALFSPLLAGSLQNASGQKSLKLKELEGEPLLDANGLKALIRLLRLAQPLGKGLLQRLLLNLSAHSIASLLFYFEPLIPEWSDVKCSDTKRDKGKEKIVGGDSSNPFINSNKRDIPLVLLLKLLNQPLFLRSMAHLRTAAKQSERHNLCCLLGHEGVEEWIGTMELELTEQFLLQLCHINTGEHIHEAGASSVSSPLPPGTQRLLPFIEAFFVLCEKLQANISIMQQDHINATAREVERISRTSAVVLQAEHTGEITLCDAESPAH
ncbi:E3 ubiquitin- protein ligase upl1 [Datura stramonium]|uniref:E3 ubiquitin- protein ligase upl1 n=1 Tax=Datura stramonium TaxID=4076 RepID=A0ABS8SB89_DATST|nr:E3 ubiquitin- protein ligase upl1 [Datura stramonium]